MLREVIITLRQTRRIRRRKKLFLLRNDMEPLCLHITSFFPNFLVNMGKNSCGVKHYFLWLHCCVLNYAHSVFCSDQLISKTSILCSSQFLPPSNSSWRQTGARLSNCMTINQILTQSLTNLSVVRLLSLRGYLDILYVKVLVFHLDPWSANLFFLLLTLLSPRCDGEFMSGRPHLGILMASSVLSSTSPVSNNPAKCWNSLKAIKTALFFHIFGSCSS